MEQDTTHRKLPLILRQRKYQVILIIILLLCIIRLALPYVILHFANKRLASMHGYYGRIRDIDLALYRGAYKVKDIYLNKKDTVNGMETEFFDAKLIDLSVHWAALLKGQIVGELDFENTTLKFTKDKVDLETVKKDTNDYRKLLDDFMPLRISRFEIHEGNIRYRDLTSNPKLDIGLTDAYVKVENLTNMKDEKLLPATAEAKANVYGGTMEINVKLDPFNHNPTFDMNAELKNTKLPELNDFFKAYGKFDVSSGIFGLYSEGAAKDGNFVGYVKPIIKDLKVLGPEDRDDNLLQKFWEGVVGTAGFIFRNQKHHQVATKVPLKGSLSKMNVNIISAIVVVLRNAFVEALQPSIDNEISISTLGEVQKKEDKKGLLKKIFDKAGKKAEEKHEEKKEEKKDEKKNK